MGVRSTLAGLLGITAAVSTPIAAQAASTRTLVEYVERNKPTGGAGTRLSAGFLEDLDQNAEVRGSKWYGQPGTLGIAGKMLRDPHVRKSIDYILHPITAAKWVFRPASSDALDQEVARFCSWCFFDRLPWSQIVRRIGVSYFSAGFALEEITDAMMPLPVGRFPNHPRPMAALVPTGFHQRPAWSVYRWHQSEQNPAQLESVEQYLVGSDGEKAGFPRVSADRLLRFTWDQEGADFEGFSILRNAYQPWKLKMLFLKLDAMGQERHAVGNPIVNASENPSDEDLDALEQSLAELRSHESGYLILPNGYSFKWEAGQSGSDVGLAIERCNTDIAVNVGAGQMRLGLTGSSGSHALANTQQGQTHLEVDSHARFIATTLWNGSDGWSPVERFVRANYGPDVAVPRPEAVNLPTRNWESTAKTYGTLVAQRAIRPDRTTEDAIREAMGLPPHDPETAYETKEPIALLPGGGAGKPDESDDAEEREAA